MDNFYRMQIHTYTYIWRANHRKSPAREIKHGRRNQHKMETSNLIIPLHRLVIRTGDAGKP